MAATLQVTPATLKDIIAKIEAGGGDASVLHALLDKGKSVMECAGCGGPITLTVYPVCARCAASLHKEHTAKGGRKRRTH